MDNNTITDGITDGIWLCIEEYDRLIKNEERLRILEQAVKLEKAGSITSGDFGKLASCILIEEAPAKSVASF